VVMGITIMVALRIMDSMAVRIIVFLAMKISNI
jgi:hypothetical protein